MTIVDQPLAAAERPTLAPNIVGATVFFNREQCNDAGKKLHETYVNNDPFPHIIIDNFLPEHCLRRVVEEFPAHRKGRFSDNQSNLKTGYQMEMIESPFITALLYALNSSQFLEFLQEMTGIKGLIPDPHFMGGGLHETIRGGHLNIHVDFNIHRALGLRRRINLIIFLNDGWKEAYGGHLELWDKDMKACRHSVAPIMGRAVAFNTDPGSFHGHPDPLTTPEGMYRRSIALYYYTAPDGNGLPPAQTTDFRPRPGSTDKRPPYSIRIRELARDLTPPIIARWLSRFG